MGESKTSASGSIAPGVVYMRVRETTTLYAGMKPFHAVSLTLGGDSVSRVDGHESEQVPGSMQLKEPGQIHRVLRRATPGSFQIVSFDAQLIERACQARGLGARARLSTLQLEPGDARAAAFRRLHHLVLARAHVLSPPDEFTTEAVVAEAIDTYASLLADVGTSTKYGNSSKSRLRASVQRARAFLLDHFTENVTLDALADHARADKFHLCRAFTAELGLPPYAFLTQARIAEARVLLRRGVRPSELAPRLGFCDQSQMHRHFVRIVGCTPGAYADSTVGRT